MDEREYEWDGNTLSLTMGTLQEVQMLRTVEQVDVLIAAHRAEEARAQLTYHGSEWEVVAVLQDDLGPKVCLFNAVIYRDGEQLSLGIGGFITPVQVIIAALDRIEQLVEPEIYDAAGVKHDLG